MNILAVNFAICGPRVVLDSAKLFRNQAEVRRSRGISWHLRCGETPETDRIGTAPSIAPVLVHPDSLHPSPPCAPLVQRSRHCAQQRYHDHNNTSAEPAAPKQPASSTLPSVTTRISPSSSAYNNSSSAPRNCNKRRSHERRRDYIRSKI